MTTVRALAVCGLLCADAARAGAATDDATDDAALDVAALEMDQRSRDFGLPEPNELFNALAKQTNPRWRTLYRPQLAYTLGNRHKCAVWLGVRLAESRLAAAARDAQQVRNLSKDVQVYGRILGIGDNIAPQLIRLDAAADAQDWNNVAAEIQAMGREIDGFLRDQRDASLAELVAIGMWLRVLEVATSVVNAKDFPELALCVGGPGLVERIAGRFARLDEATLAVPAVAEALRNLHAIADVWSAKTTPGDADVRETRARLTASLEALTSK